MADRSVEEWCAFPEPPERLTKFGSNRVIALLDEPDQAQAAVKALAEAGFNPEHIALLCGQRAPNGWASPAVITAQEAASTA